MGSRSVHYGNCAVTVTAGSTRYRQVGPFSG